MSARTLVDFTAIGCSVFRLVSRPVQAPRTAAGANVSNPSSRYQIVTG